MCVWVSFLSLVLQVQGRASRSPNSPDSNTASLCWETPFLIPVPSPKVTETRLICVFLTLPHAVFPDGVAGALRGPLQPHHPLRPPHLLQLGAQAALQEHLLLLPATHLQAEGGEAALRRRDSHYGHLQIHPSLQLRGVQLSRRRHPPRPSRLSRSSIFLGPGPRSKAVQSALVDYWIRKLPRRGLLLLLSWE